MDEGSDKNSFTDVVVKAQVHTGGRGKGYFKENGFNSVWTILYIKGIHIASSAEDAREYSSKMFGNTLITK